MKAKSAPHASHIVTALAKAVTARESAERVLPREAMWFFVVAPPILATLFDPSCLMEPWHVTRALVAITTYTVLTGLAVHHSFEALAARTRETPVALCVLLHALLCAVVVVVVTIPQLPFVLFVYPEASGQELNIAWRGVLVSYVYLSIASFIGYLQRQAVRERLRAHEERTAALEARLTTLQAQMQPHFLFNSLNVCAGLVHEAPDAAEATLDKLSGFLRYALESTERRLVTVEEEVEAVTSYLDVQRQRFGDRLRYEVDVADAARTCEVPPMLVQPLVENALLHGLRGRAEGGLVRIAATVEDDALAITVEDDGVGPGGSTHRGTGTGEKNVRERIRLVYGEAATFASRRSELGGYAVDLVLPLLGRRSRA